MPSTPSDPLLSLAPDEASASTEVVIDAGRCDPHAVTESKKTFRFATWVAVGGGEPAFVEIQPEPAARAELERLIDECLRAQEDDLRGAPSDG